MLPTPEKRRKTMSTKKKLSLLPYDLLLNIIARVSRLYYPTLSHVSKSFQSLVASPELYKVRSLLGRTERCLYVCLDSGHSFRLCTLCWKPDETLTNDTSKKKKSSGYVLTTVPIPRIPWMLSSGLVAVGSNIYNIGVRRTFYQSWPSSSFSMLDCTSNTWHEIPNLPEEPLSLSATVVDQKIYVAGCCIGGDMFEVFDTKTRIWDHKPIPCMDDYLYYCRTPCIDKKFYVVTRELIVSYDTEEDRWDTEEDRWDLPLQGIDSYYTSWGHFKEKVGKNAYCVVDNVLFYVYNGVFRWYDTKETRFKDLKGLIGLPKLPMENCVKLVDYGGKIVALWDEDCLDGYYGSCTGKYIWLAEIAIERHKHNEIWGKIEWLDHVFKVPLGYSSEKVLVVTL